MREGRGEDVESVTTLYLRTITITRGVNGCWKRYSFNGALPASTGAAPSKELESSERSSFISALIAAPFNCQFP
jgi:hypothetical protein